MAILGAILLILGGLLVAAGVLELMLASANPGEGVGERAALNALIVWTIAAVLVAGGVASCGAM